MIRSLKDISGLAKLKGPMKLAVLAPEDEEFMLAVKKSWEMGYIEPVLIGSKGKMTEIAGRIGFDIGKFEIIVNEDRQAISNLGIGMVFSGALPIASKGQIPTSYIYKSIIREEAKAGSGMNVSVVSFWEVPGVDHLVAFTDTGVNIRPDLNAKIKICQNAVFLLKLLGTQKPRISVLSGQRGATEKLQSFIDYEHLRKSAESGELGDCEIIKPCSFTDMFANGSGLPDILLVPCLDTGNVLCKLDFFLDVSRCSLVATSRGPICIPARSDFSDNIADQIALSVVVADRMKGGE